MADVNFDSLADKFAARIYGNAKGELRLRLAWRDMQEHLSLASPCQVWDAGGGMGQIAHKLAALGHQVLLTDISQNMLNLACANEAVKVQCSSIQQVSETGQQFDLVVCHAVLEWLEQPLAALPALMNCVKPGGQLSLMFYNSNSLVLGNLIKGNFRKLMLEQLAGDPGGLTPPNPLDPALVITELGKLAHVNHRRGIRLSHDLLRQNLRNERSLDDMEAMDWKLGALEPWWQLARYVHVVATHH